MKGLYTIKKYKAELVDGEWIPGELIDVIEEENIITPQLAIQEFSIDYTQNRTPTNLIIGVSEHSFVGARMMEGFDTLYSIRGALQTAATYTPAAGMDDAFWTFDCTFNPPGVSTRQIRTVYLTDAYGGATDDVFSIVALSTPCPQTTTEILQITYKLTLDLATLEAEGSRASFGISHMFSNMFASANSGAFFGQWGFLASCDRDRWGTGLKLNNTGHYGNLSLSEVNSGITPRVEGQAGETLSKHRIHDVTMNGFFGNGGISTNESLWCGYPIKGMLIGSLDGSYIGVWSMASISKGTDSSVQNTFGRTADDAAARPPFLESSIIATSAAVVNLVDKGDWVEHIDDSYTMPYLYRITMETGGIVGTATYKVRRRKMFRWQDNNVRWYPAGIPLPMMEARVSSGEMPHVDKTTATTVRHGQTIFDASQPDSSTRDPVMNSPQVWAQYMPVRYKYPEFITFDYTGITINSVNVEWTNVDADTTPALAVTEVLQIATDGSDIYVADADTGLFKIEREFGDFNASNFTITQLSPPGITDATSCRGVFAKGGSINGHPGKVVAIRVVRGGSNYAVGDTVTFSGVNGSGATAEVGAVDADGSITSITVTAQGSGYIEDYLQTYISSTTGGVGASLEPVIGAGGDIWALFNDVATDAVYLAHMTHVTTSGDTNMNFDTTGDTITRTGGDFLTDGFRPGQRLIIRTAEDAGNTGTFTITAVLSTVITVSENLTTNATDTQAQLFGEKWEIMTETITDDSSSLTFADANPDTIVGDGTSFLTQGFREGMEIVISGTASNNGTYTIADVTATTITVDSQDTLAVETVAGTLAALTDFTIANYTANATEGEGFIGLVMDPEHADDRFLMVTPTTKIPNDGTLDTTSGTAGWDWWSFANSTGTTSAGTTDSVRVANSTDNRAACIEQFGPLTVGPLSTADHWVCNGKSYLDTGYATWGSATAVTSRTLGVSRTYMPLRTTGSFNISVICKGNANSQEFRTCDVVADMSNGASSDSILLYDFGAQDDKDWRPVNLSRDGYAIGYLGKGTMLGFEADSAPSSGETSGAYVYGCNGTGTLASEDQLPYGFWEEFGWDGNDWVLGNASAKTTHAQVSFSGTGVTITAASGTIVGAGFTDWATDGFLIGDIITISNSDDPTNDGSYVIESLSGTTLTVTPDKLPAIDSSSPPDTGAVIVGDHALIDGLAVSFDDSSGANALVVGEYYDTHVYDGVLKDNATSFSVDGYFAWNADATGTDFATAVDSPSTTTTIPAADTGAVTNRPLTALYYPGSTTTTTHVGFVEPGVAGYITAATEGIVFSHKLDASTDFAVRFKVASALVNSQNAHDAHFGVVPWATIADGSDNITIGELDENIKVEHDINFPTLAEYTVRVKNTGNGADQLVYSADRVVTIAAQDETDFDGAGSNGTFIGGDGAGGTTHAVGNVITLNDGTTVTVPTGGVDGNGDVTLFDITSSSLRSTGRTEASVAGTFTSLAFLTGANTITRTGGSGFIVDGFLVGMKLIVDGSTNNDGHYTITDVADNIITVAETLTTNASENPTTFSSGLVQTSSTGSGTDFALILGTANEAVSTVANDEFELVRVGTAAGNTRWNLNGVEFFRYPGALHTATDMGLCFHGDNTGYVNIYDGEIDHELNGRFLRVGNSTTTGTLDPNFRALSGLVGGTDMMRLYYDSGSGPVEFVYNAEGYTPPAAGEVTVQAYTGLLWFNTAQAGDTITGNWTITKRDNLT